MLNSQLETVPEKAHNPNCSILLILCILQTTPTFQLVSRNALLEKNIIYEYVFKINDNQNCVCNLRYLLMFRWFNLISPVQFPIEIQVVDSLHLIAWPIFLGLSNRILYIL